MSEHISASAEHSSNAASNPEGPADVPDWRRGWIPYWEGEFTLAKIGLRERLDWYRGNPNAVKGLLRRAKDFKDKAVENLTDLNSVRAEDDEDQPDIELLKSSDEVFDVLADFQVAWELLLNKQWGRKTDNERKQRSKEIREFLEHQDDDYLVSVWRLARQSNRSRLVFWKDQFSLAGRNPDTIE